MFRYRRILMNIRIVTLLVLGFVLLLFHIYPSPARPQTQDQPQFRFETTLNEKAPTFTVTNPYSKTLTAAHFRFSNSARHDPMAELSWDPLWQGWDDSQPLSPGPLRPGASMTLYLPHFVGALPSDHVEILAGIWAHGETFGDPAKLKPILNHHASLGSSYEQVIASVQRGLDENWSRSQYLQAMRDVQNSAAVRFVVDALRRDRNPNADSASIKPVMQAVLETLKRNLDMIRPTKSPAAASQP